MKIARLILRLILNSAGNFSVESEITLENGSIGIASCPSALVAGKREKKETLLTDHETLYTISQTIFDEISNRDFLFQEDLDDYLETIVNSVGTTITLPISLAFARALAQMNKHILSQQFAEYFGEKVDFSLPIFLVPVFSGGVHGIKVKDSFQQIMVALHAESMHSVLTHLKIFNSCLLEKLQSCNIAYSQAASGGYVIENISLIEKMELLNTIAFNVLGDTYAGIAIDVAAEHIYQDKNYYFEHKCYTNKEFKAFLLTFCSEYPIIYLEDPFIPDDESMWIEFMKLKNHQMDIIGDDLFATQEQYLSSKLANGSVIKMNQVGNVSATVRTIKKLHEEHMCTCLSHRSCETEDVAICDLAVAIKSKYIKIGNINREERIMKYNQFIRLEELLSKPITP